MKVAKQRAARWRTAVNVDLMQSRMRGRRERRRGRREGWREGVITSRTWRQCTTACPAPTTSSGTSVGEWNNRLRRYHFLTPEIRTPNLLFHWCWITIPVLSVAGGGEGRLWSGEVMCDHREGRVERRRSPKYLTTALSAASPPLLWYCWGWEREREKKTQASGKEISSVSVHHNNEIRSKIVAVHNGIAH